MTIEKKRIVEDHEIFIKLIDGDNTYRRIFCGLGWPFADKPGFVVVLAEDFDCDHSIEHSPRHMRILAECESDNLEILYRATVKYKQRYLFEDVFGNRANPLNEAWQKWGYVGVLYPDCFLKVTLNIVGQFVKKNTSATRKTLNFGDSVLPGYLSDLEADKIEADNLDQLPPIAALGYCLAEMELEKPLRMWPKPRVEPIMSDAGWLAT